MAKAKKASTSIGFSGGSAEMDKAIDCLIGTINTRFGAGTIFDISKATSLSVPRVSSGSFLLDRALSGGYGLGRIVEVFGDASAGKTTLMLHAVKEAQEASRIPGHPWFGRRAAFIDVEHALDPSYAEKLGVDVEALLISQPGCAEEALNIADMLASSGVVSVICVDSVAALVPRAELEAEDIGASHVGLQARLMSQSLRRLSPISNKTKTNILFSNQIRFKVGVMFGNPETVSGGNALKFYASQRLKIVRKAAEAGDKDKDGEIYKVPTTVTVVKNKLGIPFLKAELSIEFNVGINKFVEVIELALDSGILVPAGAWIKDPVSGKSIAQGRAALLAKCKAEPDFYESLFTAVKKSLQNDLEDDVIEVEGEVDSIDESVPF